MGEDTDAGDSVDSLAERVDQLHVELEATEERPVDRAASRWIGEAQAVAGDAAALAAGADDEGTRATVHERVGHVSDLLGNVDGTGDEAADERVAAALALAEAIATENGN